MFSTAAFRSLKKFIGELTAASAKVYVATLEAMQLAEKLTSGDTWAEMASRHNVKVNGLSSCQVLSSSARMSLVSLYSGFDLYASDLREQYKLLHEREWRQHEGDSSLRAIERNSPIPQQSYVFTVGPERVNRFETPSFKNLVYRRRVFPA